jgi:hypothetical protein
VPGGNVGGATLNQTVEGTRESVSTFGPIRGRTPHFIVRLKTMKLENFSVSDDNIALEVDDMYLDLHNNFDFKAIEYSIDKRVIRLFWGKNSGEWVPEENPRTITLEFHGVMRFKMNDRDPSIPFSEDDCLSTMGFLPPEMWDYMDGYSPHKPSDEDDLLMDFMSGAALKIKAESARCVLG